MSKALLEKAEHKDFADPDEVRAFPNGLQEIVKVGGVEISCTVYEPGWRWTTSMKPIVKTHSCQASHLQYHVTGVLRIRTEGDGEFDCGPGDVSLLPPGHDAWVVGREPVTVVDFQELRERANRR